MRQSHSTLTSLVSFLLGALFMTSVACNESTQPAPPPVGPAGVKQEAYAPKSHGHPAHTNFGHGVAEGASEAGAAMPNLGALPSAQGAPQGLPSGHPPVGAAGQNASAKPAANVTIFTGPVLEKIDTQEYSYLKVKSAEAGELWAAVLKTPSKVGTEVRIQENVTMADFHSKSLNRTFKKLVMGNLLQ